MMLARRRSADGAAAPGRARGRAGSACRQNRNGRPAASVRQAGRRSARRHADAARPTTARGRRGRLISSPKAANAAGRSTRPAGLQRCVHAGWREAVRRPSSARGSSRCGSAAQSASACSQRRQILMLQLAPIERTRRARELRSIQLSHLTGTLDPAVFQRGQLGAARCCRRRSISSPRLPSPAAAGHGCSTSRARLGSQTAGIGPDRQAPHRAPRRASG